MNALNRVRTTPSQSVSTTTLGGKVRAVFKIGEKQDFFSGGVHVRGPPLLRVTVLSNAVSDVLIALLVAEISSGEKRV